MQTKKRMDHADQSGATKESSNEEQDRIQGEEESSKEKQDRIPEDHAEVTHPQDMALPDAAESTNQRSSPPNQAHTKPVCKTSPVLISQEYPQDSISIEAEHSAFLIHNQQAITTHPHKSWVYCITIEQWPYPATKQR